MIGKEISEVLIIALPTTKKVTILNMRSRPKYNSDGKSKFGVPQNFPSKQKTNNLTAWS